MGNLCTCWLGTVTVVCWSSKCSTGFPPKKTCGVRSWCAAREVKVSDAGGVEMISRIIFVVTGFPELRHDVLARIVYEHCYLRKKTYIQYVRMYSVLLPYIDTKYLVVGVCILPTKVTVVRAK